MPISCSPAGQSWSKKDPFPPLPLPKRAQNIILVLRPDNQCPEPESLFHKVAYYNVTILLFSWSHSRSIGKDATILTSHLKESMERPILFLSEGTE